MRGSIIARVGVLGQQQAEQEGIPERKARQVKVLVNAENGASRIESVNSIACHLGSAAHASSARVELLRGKRSDENAANNQGHPGDMPPDADIIQERDDAHAKDIEQGMQ